MAGFALSPTALQDGYRLVEEPQSAEVILINSCAFIGEAKQESIDAIFEQLKEGKIELTFGLSEKAASAGPEERALQVERDRAGLEEERGKPGVAGSDESP